MLKSRAGTDVEEIRQAENFENGAEADFDKNNHMLTKGCLEKDVIRKVILPLFFWDIVID